MTRKIFLFLAALLWPAAAWATCTTDGTCYINTDTCSYYGDGTANSCATSNGGTGYYRSCSEWEQYEGAALSNSVTAKIMDGDDDNADTAYCIVNGFTGSSATNFIRIEVPVSERSTTHGKIDTTKPYFSDTGSSYTLGLYEADMQIDGLQIKGAWTNPNNVQAGCFSAVGGGVAQISNVVCEVDWSSVGHIVGMIHLDNTSTQLLAWNNLSYVIGTDNNEISRCIEFDRQAANTTVWNNLCYNYEDGLKESGTNPVAYNNVIHSPVTANHFAGTFTGDYNATDSNDASNPGSNGVDSFTPSTEFIDAVEAGGFDLRLSTNSSDLYNCGSTTRGTGCDDQYGSGDGDPDISNVARASGWDLGPSECPTCTGASTFRHPAFMDGAGRGIGGGIR